MHTVDFLEPQKRHTRESKPRFLRLALVVGMFAVAIFVLGLLGMGAGVLLAFQAQASVEKAVVAAKQLDMQTALFHLDGARTDLERARISLMFAFPFRAVPILGEQIVGSEYLLSGGMDALSAARLLIIPMGEVLDIVGNHDGGSAIAAFREMPADRKKALLAVLAARAPGIEQAAVYMRSADQELIKGSGYEFLPHVRAKLDPVLGMVHTLRETLDTFAPLARLVPEMFGKDDERLLLFVFQNSDELRPTGGFIGTYGMFHAKDGDFSLSDIKDVYTLDRPAAAFFVEVPPEPFVKYLASTGWYFRDANWSPHFPESARTLLDFYTRERGERGADMDGVVAVTPRVVQRLAGLVGCMTIQKVEFCPDTFIETLQYEVEQAYDVKGIPDAQRKQIIVPLATEFLRRLYSLPSEKLPDVLEIVRDSFATKDILLWSKDTALQAAAEQAGIAGKVAYSTPDGLMVVDANLGGMKTDPYVKREIRYSVEPDADGNGATGMVAITYRNTAPEMNWKWTTYRTYTRVYLPPGTEWIETLGSLDHDKWSNPQRNPGKTVVQNELGLVSMGAFTAADIGETRTLTFRFRLAPQVWRAVQSGTYALTVLRQPGSPDPALTLDIRFGKTVRSAQPAESVRYYGDDRYQVSTDLHVDRMFTVDLK